MDYKKAHLELIEEIETELGFYEAGMKVENEYDEARKIACTEELKDLLLFAYRKVTPVSWEGEGEDG